MRAIRYLFPAGAATWILVLNSACLGQNIIGQYSVPYAQASRGPFFVAAQFVAPDGAGRLFLFNPDSAILHKFDSNGTELWAISTGITSAQSAVTGMAVTAGGVYLAGQVNGALPGQVSAGSYDAFVRKYDLNGVEVWTHQFGTADGDYVRAIAPDPGGIYVLGGKASTTPDAFFIRRYDGDGNEVWTRRFADGALSDIVGAAADSTGVYFFGFNQTSPGMLNVMRKFDSAGNDLWTRRGDLFSVVLGIAPNDQGAYVVFYPGNGAPNISVRRLDLAGSELWTRSVASSFSAPIISSDANGFYVAGTAESDLPGQCYAGQGDVFLMRFDPNGNPLWTREYGTADSESPARISIGATSVDVTGFGGSDTAFLTRVETSSAPVTGSQPKILWQCVLNAANYLGGGVAPGEIVTILGSAIGPSDLAGLQIGPDGHIATTLAGTRVLFNSEAAPLIYVSDQQSSAIVPYDIAGKGTVEVQVEHNGEISNSVTVPVLESRAGIFSFGPSGTGQAAIRNEDGSINSPFNPAARGSVVSIYATGAGLPDPPSPVDQITPDSPSPFKSSAYVRLLSYESDDLAPYFEAEVLYFGAAPRSVPGLVQINARLPLDVPVGDAVPLYFGLSPETAVEQVVTIAIR
jgi:uncharacterized protein (TIGR03437 family)